MRHPPALAAYLALTALDGGGPEEAPPPPRPEGPLLWAQADGPARLPGLAALADRLARDEGVATLVTLPAAALDALPPSAALARPVLLRACPPESAGRIAAFLGHWRPSVLLWAGGALRPGLLARTPAPRLLCEGAPDGPLLGPGRWMPGLARATLPLFGHALVTGEAEADRLSRAGLLDEQVEILPPLDPPAPVLPCNERERRDLAQTIGARPVWLAADLPLSEVAAVIAAHRHALRGAHRLLLIAAPRDAAETPVMARAFEEAGLRVSLRADGGEPEESAEVYLAEGSGESGLWLRLAPLVFLAGTLPAGPGGRHPFEAAALGSALLHGPVTAPHGVPWMRLDKAGAARLVRNAVELGQAIEGLLAPDRMARMAQGAWDVATQGAATMNRLVELILDRLDARGAA